MSSPEPQCLDAGAGRAAICGDPLLVRAKTVLGGGGGSALFDDKVRKRVLRVRVNLDFGRTGGVISPLSAKVAVSPRYLCRLLDTGQSLFLGAAAAVDEC